MPKWIIPLVVGGLVTVFLWRTQKTFAYVAGVITLMVTYYFYKK